jgi:hypothetical protein
MGGRRGQNDRNRHPQGDKFRPRYFSLLTGGDRDAAIVMQGLVRFGRDEGEIGENKGP